MKSFSGLRSVRLAIAFSALSAFASLANCVSLFSPFEEMESDMEAFMKGADRPSNSLSFP